MSKLSPEQIAQHAYDAGFRGQDLTVAVAVALAESSGKTRAHNDVPPDDSYGLWQINMLGGLGPERRRQFDLDSDRELFDPKTNAEAAFEISGRGQSFQPWSTYTNGAYKEHLDEARKAAKEVREHGGKPNGGKPNGGKPNGGKHDLKSHGGKTEGGKHEAGGFRVDPDALSGYAKAARTISDELTTLRGKELRGVHRLADDSFGKLGRQTGFAEALEHFGGSLQHQVKAVGANADKLAASVSRTARHYREQDDDLAQDLTKLLRDK